MKAKDIRNAKPFIMSNFTRFDRHEIFNSDDLSFVMDISAEARVAAPDLRNKISGLYDGYLYSDLLESVFMKMPLFFDDLSRLVTKIEQSQK